METGNDTLEANYPMTCECCNWDLPTPFEHEGQNVCKYCWHWDLKPNAPEWKAPSYIVDAFGE